MPDPSERREAEVVVREWPIEGPGPVPNTNAEHNAVVGLVARLREALREQGIHIDREHWGVVMMVCHLCGEHWQRGKKTERHAQGCLAAPEPKP